MAAQHPVAFPTPRRALAAALMLLAAPALAERPVDRVDPFIGTDGTGHTFPGPSRPFGMVQPGPDNADEGWDYTSGYQYRAPRILGFSNSRFSGTGIPEMGDLLLMPATGRSWTAATTDFGSRYDKKSEAARPGFYTVTLTDNAATVELTATHRVALHRIRFAPQGQMQLLVDTQHMLRFGSTGTVVSADVAVDAARGEITGRRRTKNWVERETGFALRFDRPIESVTELPRRPGDAAPRYLLAFSGPRTLEARVALSTVDAAAARANLAEADGQSFDQVRADADREWNSLLGRLTITGSPEQQRLFTSALYRILLHPSDIADRDGRVRGPDGQVFAARGGHYYSTLSLWDTFRGVHPLLTLIAPERVDGFILSMLDHHRAQGLLPLWTAWGRETYTMIGNPALPVIADAMAKGFTGFDHREALTAMVETSTRERPAAPDWAQRSWKPYLDHGYVPFDKAPGESVSKTLEYGIGDDAVARAARLLGDTATADTFAHRAQGYRLLFDPETRAMRGRDSAGRWRTPFNPDTPTSPLNNPGDYTEANAWQYTPTPALHDPAGFRDLLGGRQALEAWLDAFFAHREGAADNRYLGQEAMIGHYAHGNEPSHHIAWLYDVAGRPDKADALVRRIATDFYGPGPDGIIGNDDAGQMSAWYVLATIGLYPLTPGSGSWITGTPLAAQARLKVPNGADLVIRRATTPRPGLPHLDGKPFDPLALPHQALVRARLLELGPARP